MLKIGDIISLKSHAYLENLTDIIISGEQLFTPPLMVISEILKVQKPDHTIAEKIQSPTFEYTCIWFSSKSQKFEKTKLKDIHIKLINTEEEEISVCDLNEGSLITLKSTVYELSKKKASLTYEDTSLHNGSGSTLINALLSFLCPTLQVISVKEHKNELPLFNKKTNEQTRFLSKYDVKCLWYNSSSEKFSEETLPIEVLKSISVIEESKINFIDKAIKSFKCIKVKINENQYLIKPRLITYRSGYYFLRGFDYILNRMIEHKIDNSVIYEIEESPFENIAPKFDVERSPEAVSHRYMKMELKEAIAVAKEKSAYIRIKYKNRNDQITIRTIKEYRLVEGNQGNDKVMYLVGFCMLRQSERTFNIDRILNYQEIKLSYQVNHAF